MMKHICWYRIIPQLPTFTQVWGRRSVITVPPVLGKKLHGSYKKVESVSACKRITSKAECDEAARQLGLKDTEAKNFKYTANLNSLMAMIFKSIAKLL